MKKILFLTGTRADFGKLKTLINEVITLEDFEYDLFVTGMHLLKRYGNTFNEIIKSGYKNIHTYINQHHDEPMEMVLANTIQGLSRYIAENRPDLIVIHGDRVESLAGAIVGSINNILVAHIEGGERSGTIDELIRHSITKLSHIHLVSNKEAKKRIIQMGENSESVFVIGSADIDIMKSKSLPSIEEVMKYYNITYTNYHIVLFHPITSEISQIKYYANELVDALIDSGENYIIIYPNNDMGSNQILETYEKINKKENFRVFPSLRFEYFLTLLENALSIIGNSSAGIREAPIFGIPSINIGTRQNLRFKYESIVDTSYQKKEILEVIKKVSEKTIRYNACEYFGSGNSALKFKKLIKEKKFWDTPSQKTFNDFNE